ncbi:MAG: hypothetical protein SF123_18325 [Chloroflexota bacterium]|nr:hypothetical protein [Chloroflexota bacterium]
MTTITTEEALEQSKRRHQREVMRFILLPMLLGVLVIVAVMIVVVALPRTLQVSAVADIVLTLFILCPLALCFLPFSLGLSVLALMSNRVTPAAAKPLRRGEALTLTISQRAVNIADKVARASIGFNARLAPLTRWMDNAFTRKNEDNHDDKSAR